MSILSVVLVVVGIISNIFALDPFQVIIYSGPYKLNSVYAVEGIIITRYWILASYKELNRVIPNCGENIGNFNELKSFVTTKIYDYKNGSGINYTIDTCVYDQNNIALLHLKTPLNYSENVNPVTVTFSSPPDFNDVKIFCTDPRIFPVKILPIHSTLCPKNKHLICVPFYPMKPYNCFLIDLVRQRLYGILFNVNLRYIQFMNISASQNWIENLINVPKVHVPQLCEYEDELKEVGIEGRTKGIFNMQTVFPFMISIYKDNVYICEASIIGPYTALTAAQCIKYSDIDDYYLQKDTYDKSGIVVNRDSYYIRGIDYHPEWNPKTFDYNFALICTDYQLYEIHPIYPPISFKDFICVSNYQPEPNSTMVVAGSRDLFIKDEKHSDVYKTLRKGDSIFIPSWLCRKNYTSTKNIKNITSTMFCTTTGPYSCKVKPGGALIDKTNNCQIGVVSQNQCGCCRSTVYSDVTQIEDWINKYKVVCQRCHTLQQNLTRNQQKLTLT